MRSHARPDRLPIDGNAVRLLQDAGENYPGLARRDPRRPVLDPVRELHRRGRRHRARVRRGAGGESARRRRRAGRLRLARFARFRRAVVAAATAGAHVLAFNRPRLDSPLGWLTRDHRKTIVVDGGPVSSRACASARNGWAIPRGAWSPGATRASRFAARRSRNSRARSKPSGTPAAASRRTPIASMRRTAAHRSVTSACALSPALPTRRARIASIS